jgi:hypothetical protein
MTRPAAARAGLRTTVARRRSIPTTRRGGRRRGVAACLLAAILGTLATAAPPEVDPVRVAAVKAQLLCKFFKYVEWPKAALGRPQDPLVIGVLGRDPFGAIIDRLAEAQTVGGKPIEVRRIESVATARVDLAASAAGPRDDETIALAARLRQCHVLFIAESERAHWKRLLELLEGAPVLTVSDIPGSAEDGGMVEFVLEEQSKVKLRINRQATEEANLRMSAKLLALATIVRSE